MRTVDAVLFDKTGTLTQGRPAVRDVAASACRARRSSGWRPPSKRQRAPARAGDRRRRPGGRDPRRVGLPGDDRVAASQATVERRRRSQVGGPALLARARARATRRARRGDREVAGPRRDRARPCCATAGRSGRSRSRTRSGPSRVEAVRALHARRGPGRHDHRRRTRGRRGRRRRSRRRRGHGRGAPRGQGRGRRRAPRSAGSRSPWSATV